MASVIFKKSFHTKKLYGSADELYMYSYFFYVQFYQYKVRYT